ncbi:MAG: hypothetical protein CMJ87_05515 [Planctomycetes bacterium]|jgi:hypothetical protein|nr:hypothetical protein [Planctomycetota bacterium]
MSPSKLRPTSRLRFPPKAALALVPLLASLVAVPACRGPEFFEKQDLGRAVMRFEDDPTETHVQQKVFYATEGAAGGIGSSGGGGCGCN